MNEYQSVSLSVSELINQSGCKGKRKWGYERGWENREKSNEKENRTEGVEWWIDRT